nr:MAG TPA: AntA/AntB antirepressor [Caudoviricetes sp.]
MEEIIKIEDHNGKRAVNARELHDFLESKSLLIG